jgi:prevent-host-death family protein
MMTDSLNVAELKRRFSEILSRVELRGERITVRRRGRTVAILVPATDIEDAALVATTTRRGLAAAAGAWEEHPDVERFIAEIRAARDASTDRTVEAME